MQRVNYIEWLPKWSYTLTILQLDPCFNCPHPLPLPSSLPSPLTLPPVNRSYGEQKMEEQKETLLDYLKSFGVSIPSGAASLTDLLSPAALISICAQCLNLMDGSSSFPTSLPDSTEERFKVCSDISASIKSMGFVGDLSFYEVKLTAFLFLSRFKITENGVRRSNSYKFWISN